VKLQEELRAEGAAAGEDEAVEGGAGEDEAAVAPFLSQENIIRGAEEYGVSSEEYLEVWRQASAISNAVADVPLDMSDPENQSLFRMFVEDHISVRFGVHDF
jgi:hypothetical protein